jgi:bifunctional DNA-binding transcriptional regulator/antitoxin component of YhaV-PrlF toxin-antitoxin module
MEQVSCKVDTQGRITLPLDWRREQKVAGGSEVVLIREDGALRIQSVERSLSEAQALVAKYLRPGSSALDDLRQERRRQFASEDAEFERHAESL